MIHTPCSAGTGRRLTGPVPGHLPACTQVYHALTTLHAGHYGAYM